MKSEKEKKKLAVVIESRACESRACVHVYTYWCSRHRQYCNTHEVTVSKTKGMEHGHGTQIIISPRCARPKSLHVWHGRWRS